MRLPALVLLLCLVPFLAAAPARAAESCEGYYFDPMSITPDLLPPPPAETSPAWREQIKAVIAAQHHPAADDLTATNDEQNFRLEIMTGPLGPRFNPSSLPATFALLDHVMADAGCVNDAAKKFWKTRRPYVASDKVKLMVRPVNSFAYPSGHTSGTRVLAEILGSLLPRERAAFRDHAAAVARHRVIAGVHYPADLEGGRLEAMQILGALYTDDSFQRDLAAAQHELAEQHWQ